MSDFVRQVKKMVDKGIEEAINKMHTSQLCVVTSLDYENMKAIVKLKHSLECDGIKYEPQDMFDVPITHFRNDSMIIRKPIKVGDICMLTFSEIEIDDQIIDKSFPIIKTERRFNINDGVLTPLNLKIESDTRVIDATYDNDLVIFNSANGSYIVITESNDLKVLNYNNVEIQCKTIDAKCDDLKVLCSNSADITSVSLTANVSGETKITSPNISLIGNVDITGNITATGNLAMTGALVAQGTIAGAGISLDKHIHEYTHNGLPTYTKVSQ